MPHIDCCHGCEHRCEGCHATCGVYKKQKTIHTLMTEQKRSKNNAYAGYGREKFFKKEKLKRNRHL